jgi:hypothetical protein
MYNKYMLHIATKNSLYKFVKKFFEQALKDSRMDYTYHCTPCSNEKSCKSHDQDYQRRSKSVALKMVQSMGESQLLAGKNISCSR